jgi:hypothetical protein
MPLHGCGSTVLQEGEDSIACRSCGATFAVRDGIYDFREPTVVRNMGDSARNS